MSLLKAAACGTWTAVPSDDSICAHSTTMRKLASSRCRVVLDSTSQTTATTERTTRKGCTSSKLLAVRTLQRAHAAGWDWLMV